MHAFMTVFVDELLRGETAGFNIVDHSKALSSPDRVFRLKIILLFWVADYPGMGKCAHMKHAGFYGCHWCMGYFYTHSQGHNVCIHNRRFLRKNHPYRTDERWGPHETRDPPQLRTTAQVEAQSREIDDMDDGPDKGRKQQSTGIYGFCLLLLLGMFDIVWDMLPDMMHITKGSFIATYTTLLLDYVFCYACVLGIVQYCTNYVFCYACVLGIVLYYANYSIYDHNEFVM
jgi:hypothetical protein